MITDVESENNTIHKNWYSGERALESLLFKFVPIRYIEPDAFASSAFWVLKLLSIENTISVIDYRPEIFRGLRIVDDLILTGTITRPSYSSDFLVHVRKVLKFFHCGNLVLNHQSLTNLFGGQRMRLPYVSVDCSDEPGNTNFLAADNFSALAMVEYIDIYYCNFEYIEPGTFDVMTDTLRWITIVGGRLLRINFELFRKMFDVVPWSLENHYYKKVTIEFDSILCENEYDKIRNMSTINGIGVFFKCNDSTNQLVNVGQQYIRNAQRFTEEEKLHEIIAFPKFMIHYDTKMGNIIVTQVNSDPFRMLFWNTKSIGQRAPPGGRCTQQMQIDARCWRWKNVTTSSIPRSMVFSKLDVLIACVILKPSIKKQAIPLHCATIRLPEYDAIFSPIQWQSIAGALTVQTMIFLGLFWCRMGRQAEEAFEEC